MNDTHPVVERAEQIMSHYLADLEAIVNIDSGTYNREGVNRVGAYVQRRFHDFGFTTYFDEQVELGDNLVATHKGRNEQGPRIVLIGHMDTVFLDGEAEKRPFTIQERADGMRIAKGPGVLDMKSGLLLGMYGLHLLIEDQQDNYQSVTFICNSDEEIGSPISKPLIQKLAQGADAVIVLEPGRALNAVVSARRGVGNYHIDVLGVAAHAGVEPGKGRNAILELAHKVQALQALHGTIKGTSLAVTIINGGTRTNVVPDHAYCKLDVRVSDHEGAQSLEKAIRRIVETSTVEGTSAVLSGGLHCQPFEKTEGTQKLLRYTREAGKELGLQIEDIATGGASDANNTAAIGVPTIDGLGPGGGLAHNPNEYLELDYLPLRIALLTGLVQQICQHHIS